MWLFIVRIVIYGFLGWGLEGIHNWFVYDSFYKPNFLYGPIKPMYGIAGAVLVQMKNERGFRFFLLAALIPLCIEYLTGLGLYLGYGLQYWDYSNLKYQYQGIICLPYAFFWVMLTYFTVWVIHPQLEKFYRNHKDGMMPGMICAALLFSSDIIITFWKRAGGI